ncbi:MAG: hypothetical protein RL341_883, partial [Pseudomonadota bacterium]
QGSIRTQKVVALTEPSCRTSLPQSAIWCDSSELFTQQMFADTGRIGDSRSGRNASAGTAPLSRSLLSELEAGFVGHIRLLRSDAVIASAATDAAMIVFLAATAWLRGARLILADDLELDSHLKSKGLAGLAYVDSAVLAKIPAHKSAQLADMTLIIDAAQNSVQTTTRMLESGYAVYNIQRSSGLGLPVAMGLVSHARDAAIIGHALADDLLSLRDDQGNVLGAGLIGTLRVDLGTDIALNEPVLVRERSDGVLQFIGSIEQANGIEVVNSAVRLRPSQDAPAKMVTTAPVEQAAPSASAVSPKVSAEQLMVSVWKEVLGVSEVTARDNFFELGGSSLSAMQAAEAVEQRLGKRVSPRRYVFETLGQLAAAYDGTEDKTTQTALPAVAPAVVAATRERGLASRFKRLVGLT